MSELYTKTFFYLSRRNHSLYINLDWRFIPGCGFLRRCSFQAQNRICSSAEGAASLGLTAYLHPRSWNITPHTHTDTHIMDSNLIMAALREPVTTNPNLPDPHIYPPSSSWLVFSMTRYVVFIWSIHTGVKVFLQLTVRKNRGNTYQYIKISQISSFFLIMILQIFFSHPINCVAISLCFQNLD